MARVRIKTQNPKDPRRKLKLLEILSSNEIYATKIIETKDAFIILTNNEDDPDRIFNGTTDTQLQENQSMPQIPPELQDQRSVKVFSVDSHIYNHDEQEKKDAIMTKHNFTSNEIDNIVKIPKPRIIKITIKTQTSKKATEQGLLMFSMSILSH